MNLVAHLAGGLARRRRLAAYRNQRAALEAMSDGDLADIGMRRWQLGAVARREALSRA